MSMDPSKRPQQTPQPGDCAGCGAEYPHCDCAYLADEDGAADAREAMETAWEILDG